MADYVELWQDIGHYDLLEFHHGWYLTTMYVIRLFEITLTYNNRSILLTLGVFGAIKGKGWEGL